MLNPRSAVAYRIALITLLLVSLPYLSAILAAGTNYTFGGFLLNPVDGNSYLAKMYQGWRGDWKFTLPYSADPGQGAYLFTFYLLLGHLARWLGAPLLWIFHGARLLGAVALVGMLSQFFNTLFPEGKYRGFACALACLSLGLGWLVFPFGRIASDFWVAEAFPFLSAYVNPHFAWSLALLVWLLMPAIQYPVQTQQSTWGWMHWLGVFLASACTASMSPFAVVLALVILGGTLIWELAAQLPARQREILSSSQTPGSIEWGGWSALCMRQIAWIALGGIPVMSYAFFAVRQDRVLAAWNAQNLTFTPPAWDLALAFSPALILALPGIWLILRGGGRSGRLLAVWAAIAFSFAFAPFGLQRRFLVGAAIPLAGLAAYGMEAIAARRRTLSKALPAVLFALALPTVLLVLLLGQYGVQKHDPLLYLEKSESRALEWLVVNTPQDALVLASPRMGMYIPAHTGRRVIYGHPFETVNAEVEMTAVEQFFVDIASNPEDASTFLQKRKIDFVFCEADQPNLQELADLPGLERVYARDGVLIFRAAAP